jgi:hypothetical protein
MVSDSFVSDSFCVPGDGLLTVPQLPCAPLASPDPAAAGIPGPLDYAAGDRK